MRRLLAFSFPLFVTACIGARIDPLSDFDFESTGDASTKDSGVGDTSTPIDSNTFDSNPPPFDGFFEDTGFPADSSPFDAQPIDVQPIDAPPPFDAPSDATTGTVVGKVCNSDTDCANAAGTGQCSNTLFGADPINPVAYCVTTGCDPGNGTTTPSCEGNAGLCFDLSGTGQGICIPQCTFNRGGGVVSNCPKGDGCFFEGEASPGSLLGYCFGGCTADANCPNGSHCLREYGECLFENFTFPKSVGSACTNDDNTQQNCQCIVGGTDPTSKGFCSEVCRNGDPTTCAKGLVCDPLVPVGDEPVPADVAGWCLPSCTSDADCQKQGGVHCVKTLTGLACEPF